MLTIGGSTTECFNLADDATWTARLDSRLHGRFRSLWTNNAGFDGNSTFAHLILMQNYVIQLKPRVVMLYVGLNDIGRDNPTEYDDAIQLHENRYERAIGRAKRSLLRLANTSEVAAVALNFYRYANAKDNRLIRGDQLDLAAAQHGNPFPGRSFEDYLAFHERQFMPRYRERLRRLLGVASENGIQPILVTQPALYGDLVDEATGVNLGTAILARWLARDLDGRNAWRLLEAYNDVTRQVARETETPLVEVARRMPKNSTYFTDAIHYTNQGADKIAEIIFEQICPVLQERFKEFNSVSCM